MTTTRPALRISVPLAACVTACFLAPRAQAQLQYFPPVPVAPENMPDNTVSWFTPYLQYIWTYDNNVFRIPSVHNYPAVAALIPPGTSVADHINTGSVGFDGHWLVSRQSIDYDFEVDENAYVRNTDLNNPSGLAKALWNWSFAADFNGQIGSSYSRALTGFADSLFFQRDMIDRQEYFANGRYQVGPRLAIYGGVDDTYTRNENTQERYNDLNLGTGKVGAELATSQLNSLGVEYDYSHGHYPDPVANARINGVLYNPDFDQDTLSVLFKYAPTDKTTLSGDAGYLIRDYPNNFDHPHIGQFSGDIWHLKGQWQPTDKTSLLVTASRDLAAYTFAQADYFVQTGVSLSPSWVQSEKLTWVLVVAWYDQNYINASTGYINASTGYINATAGGVPPAGPRHDTITSQQAALQYTPIRALVFTVSYRHELRNSNQPQFGYGDDIANAGVKFKF
jgi:hypothetical protein